MKRFKYILLILVVLFVWKQYVSDNQVSIPEDNLNEIESIVDDTSNGKVQVNYLYVAAIASAETDGETVNTSQISKITNLFIDKQGNQYKLKNINDVAAELYFTKDQKDEVQTYLQQFNAKHTNDNTTQQKFIQSLERPAIENYHEYGILPSVTIAQAILESNWGKSQLSQDYNNLFGIKAHNWKGATASLDTKEHYNQKVKSSFRVYDTLTASVKDHGLFLNENPRYKKHGVFSSNTYMEQAMALQEAGYSTAKNENGEKIYSELLINLIKQHDLQLLDSQVQMEKSKSV